MAPSPSLTAAWTSPAISDISNRILSWLAQVGDAISHAFLNIGLAIRNFPGWLLDHIVDGLKHVGQFLLRAGTAAGSWIVWFLEKLLLWFLAFIAAFFVLRLAIFFLPKAIRYLRDAHGSPRHGSGLLNQFVHRSNRYGTFEHRSASRWDQQHTARTAFTAHFSRPEPWDEPTAVPGHTGETSNGRPISDEAARARARQREARAEAMARDEARRKAEAQEAEHRRLALPKAFGDWKERMSRLTYEDVKKLPRLPDPPTASSSCGEASCNLPDSMRRSLGFCSHSLEEAFTAYTKAYRINDNTAKAELLKNLVIKCSPNWQGIVESNETVKKQAAEMASILNNMASSIKGSQTA